MAPKNPGQKVYVTADTAVRHGAPAADNGYVGLAWKQKTEDVKTVLPANLSLIAVSEKYLLEITGEIKIPNTGITGAAKGDIVYIRTTDNALALSTATNFVPLGKVSCLPGERGLPATGFYRVNLNQKA